MASSILLLCVGIIAAASLSKFRAYRLNLAAAKATGLPFVWVPLHWWSKLWMALQPICMPYLLKLPKSWTDPWLAFCNATWKYHEAYKPYAQIGSDTFIAVHPDSNMLWTCDPEVISQISARRNDFPKPLEHFGAINVHGPNLAGSEGAQWRRFRKVMSPSFSEKNNEIVWTETLDQTRSMLESWLGNGKSGLVPDVSQDTMLLALHVISRAGFGKKLVWPDRGGRIEEQNEQSGTVTNIPPGHSLSFRDALADLLPNIITVILTPLWLLKSSPLDMHKNAWLSYSEWRKYMKEMLDERRDEMHKNSREGVDLLDFLAQGKRTSKPFSTAQALSNGQETASPSDPNSLTEAEVYGNLFIFIMAGHETTARTLAFAMLLLACNPSCQIRLQKDLDEIFSNRTPSSWSYEKDLPRLLRSSIGAILNETLRLIPPLHFIPKSTNAGPQSLVVSGRKVVIPANTLIHFDVMGAHHNAKYWPRAPSQSSQGFINDLSEFRPDRWLQPEFDNKKETFTSKTAHTPDHEHVGDGNSGTENDSINASLPFQPPHGLFIPFSQDARGCIGRRFAQVEFSAVIAHTFREYSVELVVPGEQDGIEEEGTKWNGADRAVDRVESKRRAWGEARKDAEHVLKEELVFMMTMKPQRPIAIRLVRRGEEEYMNL